MRAMYSELSYMEYVSVAPICLGLRDERPTCSISPGKGPASRRLQLRAGCVGTVMYSDRKQQSIRSIEDGEDGVLVAPSLFVGTTFRDTDVIAMIENRDKGGS